MTIWRRYSLGIVLGVLFLAAWAVMTWTDWVYFVAEQAGHHQPADVFGSSGYVWRWGEDTFSNWQSDILWAGLAILLTAYFIFRGSAESKDGDERIEELANSIEAQIRGQDVARQAEARTDRAASWGGIWRNRGFAFSLIGAGIITWALMTWMGWMNFSAMQQEHGSTAEVFGSSGYIWDWATLTLQNWQSDILGNAATIVLSAYLLFVGSGMSRGSDDEIEQALERIHGALEGKHAAGGPQPAAPAPSRGGSARRR